MLFHNNCCIFGEDAIRARDAAHKNAPVTKIEFIRTKKNIQRVMARIEIAVDSLFYCVFNDQVDHF